MQEHDRGNINQIKKEKIPHEILSTGHQGTF